MALDFRVLNFSLVMNPIDKMKKEREITQYTLSGQKCNNNTTVNHTVNRTACFRLFSEKDTIWQTLQFFDNLRFNGIMTLTTDNLYDLHEESKQVHINTIKNNIKRLIKKGFIHEIEFKVGRTRRQKLFKITSEGIKFFEEYVRWSLKK